MSARMRRISIRGFKTYREETIVGEFADGLNVFVGLNGHGKSNVMEAVLFVISDKYENLRENQRRALLHEGAEAQSAGTAVVEITLEVLGEGARQTRTVRRVMSLKKDEVFVDERKVTRTELTAFLETLGIAAEFPYFAVQQGRVARLAAMSAEERLELVREVAGVRGFEERKSEALKALDQAKQKLRMCEDLAAAVQGKFTQAELDMQKFQDFQVKANDKRLLEFALVSKELELLKTQVASETGEKSRLDAKLAQLQTAADDSTDRVSTLTGLVERGQARLVDLNAAAESLARKLALCRDRVAAAQLQAAAARTVAPRGAPVLPTREALVAQARELTVELEALRGLTAAKQDERGRLEQRFSQLEVERSRLITKRGVSQLNFNSPAERKSYFANLLADLHMRRDSVQTSLAKLTGRCAAVEADLRRLAHASDAEAEDALGRLHEAQTELGAVLKAWTSAGADAKQQTQIVATAQMEADLSVREAEVAGANVWRLPGVPAALRLGFEAVGRMTQGKSRFPMLGAVLEVQDAFHAAVETAAGLRLFDVLVDSTANLEPCVQAIRSVAGARGRLIALDRAMEANSEFAGSEFLPSVEGAIPLVNVVKFPAFAEPAVRQVLGGWMCVKDLETGTAVAREYKVNCVTLDGDVVNKSGVLTSSGFHDKRSFQRIAGFRAAAEAAAACAGKAQQLAEAQARLADVQRTRDELDAVKCQLEQRLFADKVRLGEIRDQQEVADRRRVFLTTEQTQLQRQVAETRRELEEVQAEVAHAENLPAQAHELTAVEAGRLTLVSSEISNVQKSIDSVTSELQQISGRMRAVQTDLQDEVQAKFRLLEETAFSGEVMSSTPDGGTFTGGASTASLERAVERNRREISDLQARLRQFVADKDEADETLTTLTKELGECRLAKDALLSSSGLQSLQAKQADRERLLLTCGSLEGARRWLAPEISIVAVKKELTSVSRWLNSTSVNKKAEEVFEKLNEQHSEISGKLKEATDGLDAISELLAELETRKVRVTHECFDALAEKFAEIFARLSLGGHGRLVMASTGVQVEASFLSEQQPPSVLSMTSLSGGQKTVVAVALLISMQHVDPAPLYFFDEIDAALDVRFRQAVAQLLAECCISGPSQIFCTSFRPELVQAADRHFLVSLEHRRSRVSDVSRAAALDLVKRFK